MYKNLTFEQYKEVVSDYNENGGDITYLLSELEYLYNCNRKD